MWYHFNWDLCSAGMQGTDFNICLWWQPLSPHSGGDLQKLLILKILHGSIFSLPSELLKIWSGNLDKWRKPQESMQKTSTFRKSFQPLVLMKFRGGRGRRDWNSGRLPRGVLGRPAPCQGGSQKQFPSSVSLQDKGGWPAGVQVQSVSYRVWWIWTWTTTLLFTNCVALGKPFTFFEPQFL